MLPGPHIGVFRFLHDMAWCGSLLSQGWLSKNEYWPNISSIFVITIPVRRHVWRWTSEPEIIFGVASMSRLSGFRDIETGDARANVQSPHLRLLYLVTIGPLATHQILAKLVNRILRYGARVGVGVHVRTCRDAPPHPWLVESTYLVTPNPHTKFEHNPSNRSWDSEARCARAHVQRYFTHDLC